MSARLWWLLANAAIPAALGGGVVVFGLHGGTETESFLFGIGAFVLPAVLASALATVVWGWRRLDRSSERKAGSLLLAAQTVALGFALFFVAVALIWPLVHVLGASPTATLSSGLAQGVTVGIFAVGFAVVVGSAPALALCWWTTRLALRRRRAERAGAP